ncbi:MAG: hypothetical protein JST27_07050 [Bacteroidetes bacterium]|nr:hypothetical protein [Bacteroidota bacterium]
MSTVTLTRVQPEFGFDVVDEHGIHMRMDTSADHGGQGFGVSPMNPNFAVG